MSVTAHRSSSATSATTTTVTATAVSSSRIPLQALGPSSLNARALTSTLSHNFKTVIDRTPQLKRAITVDLASLPSSAKKHCRSDTASGTAALPSPATTPTTASVSVYDPAKDAQIRLLKTRLQLAYYKVKNRKTAVSASDLVRSLPAAPRAAGLHRNHPVMASFQNQPHQPHQPQSQTQPHAASTTRTPMAKRTTSDLLASSTPIPKASIAKKTNSARAVSFNFKVKDYRPSPPLGRNDLHSTTSSLKAHPFLPQINQMYTSSSPSRFASVPAIQVSRPASAHASRRSLKAPELPKRNAMPLPSLKEVKESMLMPGAKSFSGVANPAGDDMFTPIRAKRNKTATTTTDDTTQLMSSPSKLLTTPSSMGAAKSLLQLAFVNKD